MIGGLIFGILRYANFYSDGHMVQNVYFDSVISHFIQSC